MSSYENGYFGIPSLNYDKMFSHFIMYFTSLYEHIMNVNKPCAICNNFKDIEQHSTYVISIGCYSIYRYFKYFIVKFENKNIFLVLDDQTPSIITDTLELYYKDCLSDTAIQSITLKGELYGSTLCFYIDRYQALTVYENLNENYIYTPMTISDIKKKCYKQHLWKRSFTYESKRNCSC